MTVHLDKLEQLLQAATPRPWKSFNGGVSSGDPAAIERWRERSIAFARSLDRLSPPIEAPEEYAAKEIAAYGGGALVAESMQRADSNLVAEVVNEAPALIAELRAAHVTIASLRRDLGVFIHREAERMATSAIAAVTSAPAPPVLLLDNTVFLEAACALERELAVLSAWSDDEEAVEVVTEAIDQLRRVGRLAKTGAPNERGYPEITVRVQGVSAERDE